MSDPIAPAFSYRLARSMGEWRTRPRLGVLAVALMVASCTSTPSTTSPSPDLTTVPQASTTTEVPCAGGMVCVEVRIDPVATWSDGTPVTAVDIAYTLDDEPVIVEVVDDLTVSITAEEKWDAWLRHVLPAHSQSSTSSGYDIEVGAEAIILRDRTGARSVSELSVVAADGVRGVIGALRTGQADMVWLSDPPSWAVEELAAIDGVTVSVTPGPDWEMITMNAASPALAEDHVRQAIALALDREAILDATVRTVQPGAAPLRSTLRMAGPGSVPYPFPFDPLAARQLLADHGCVLADDGIQVCSGTRLSLVWATTAGDPWREAALDAGAAMLREVGIEVRPVLLIPSDLFAEDHLFGTDWDLISFAWSAQEDPRDAAELYRCQGEGPHGYGQLNIGRHCFGFDEVLDTIGRMDGPGFLDALTAIDSAFMGRAAIIPLYPRPVLSAVRDGLRIPLAGPFDGPFGGLDSWEGTGAVNLALTSLPGHPATTAPVDAVTASLRRALYRGAFKFHPVTGLEPDLVVSFTVVRGGE